MTFADIYYGQYYRLYVPPSHLDDLKVKYRITTQTTMMEMEPLTKGIVIFGATGDLCKRKLIPALYKLWGKNLLPEGFSITGASRRNPGKDAWIESLGDYPEEFKSLLDYISCDLSDTESLHRLPE